AAEATANPPFTFPAMLLAAFRGEELEASHLFAEARDPGVSQGEGRNASFADYASAVIGNALGRHDRALAAARRVFDRDVVAGYRVMAVAELAEAASRTGDRELLARARSRAVERAAVTGSDWALGVAARIEALELDGTAAESRFRESIDSLGRAG